MDACRTRPGQAIHPDTNMNEYTKVISFDELYKGLIKSARGVMWKDSVAGHVLDGMRKTYKLRQSLINGTYRISPYQVFMIHEPKEREIVATRIKDRQYQRSLCDNILVPEITKGFIYDNCACQKGKGIDFAIDRMDTHLHRHYRKNGSDGWVLRCDIRHYFPETSHEVAKSAVRKRIKDDRAYHAVCDIIDSFGGEKGIGLGSQVSQLIQLAVLDDMDHYIKERLRIKHYIRYMDDFILIHHDRGVLEHCLAEIRKIVNDLGLELNEKTQIHPLKNGIKFLKWRFILTKTGKVVRRMSRRGIVRERRRLRHMRDKCLRGEVQETKMYESFQSWRSHARRGNTRTVELKMTRLYDKFRNEVRNHERNFYFNRTGTGESDSADEG